MIKSKLRTIERQRATALLRAPQLLLLHGDGIAARGVLAPLTGGPDSYLGRTKKGGWHGDHHIDPCRVLYAVKASVLEG
jgi:hypothetical protein